MDTIFRALFIYLFLLMIFRISGKRTMAQITSFDLLLTFIIGNAVQQAILVDDYSVTNAVLLVVTLVGLDILISVLKQHSSPLARLIEGTPLIVVENGRAHHHRMQMARIDEYDILAAARQQRGVERMEQIKYAVLEAGGAISIIPWTEHHG